MSDKVTVECWENQRYVMFKGWGTSRLPTDRPSWSDKKGSMPLHREAFLLPINWEWCGGWEIEPHKENMEGWYYAADYTISTRFCSQKSSPLAMVRRRKWVRTRKQVDDDTRNIETLWHHSVWCGSLSYGFPGCSREEFDRQQSRQHTSFMSLHPLLKANATTNEQVNSPENQQNGNSPTNTNNDAMASPGGPSSDLLVSGNSFTDTTYSPGYNYGSGIGTPPRVSPATSGLDPRAPNTQHAGTPMRLPTKKYVEIVYKHGVPNCLRRQLWLQWSGAIARRSQFPGYFTQLADRASMCVDPEVAKEISQDVVRTAPNHPFFNGKGSPGTLRLTNTLMALSLHAGLPEYHQAFSYIVAVLLLNMSQEDGFWLMTVVLQHFLPMDYHYGIGLQNDLRILVELITECHPEMEEHFQQHQIDVSVFASGWIQGLFCAHFPFASASRFFDVMFAEGNTTMLVRVPMAFLKMHREELMTMDGSGSLGQLANTWSREKFDVEDVCQVLATDGLAARVAQRRKELMNAQLAAVEEVRRGSVPPSPQSENEYA